MTVSIVPTSASHFAGLHRVIDRVAREKRFLAFTEAPPLEEACGFFRNIVDKDLCQFVALNGDDVVGWCDVLPVVGQARAHVGTYGIGVLPDCRGRGIGTRLTEATLAKALTKGLTRIELTVRVDNTGAIALYERFGFVVEGRNRDAFRVDARDYDTWSMALVR